MSDPMEGYVFASDKDRREAQKWFERHAREIPDMDEGSRINGDPIVYLGIPEEWQLRALQPHRFEGELETGKPQHNTLVDQILRKAVIGADLTPVQAWVLVLKAFGVSQKQIAATLRVTEMAVTRAGRSAIRKINNGLEVNNL